MYKQHNLVLLPTDKQSNFPFFIDTSKENKISLNEGINKNKWNYDVVKPQHLYVLSDEPIKEGDWVYRPNYHEKIGKYLINDNLDNGLFGNDKKIIATTDKLLGFKCGNNIPLNDHVCTHKIYLPQPSQSFIQKYIEGYNKGNIITEVLVEYEKEVINPNPKYDLLIIDENNCINIKSIKDSWNREEVKCLLDKLADELIDFRNMGELDYDKWIKENL